MKRFGLILIYVTLTAQFLTLKAQDKKSYDLATIAFYNLENLFDTIVDPDTTKILQDEFTPKGKNAWNSERYNKKIQDMSEIISKLGADLSNTAPTIVGISEIENRFVVEDLINSDNLKKYDYGIVHYDSPDQRGIDVGLIYRKEFVKIVNSTTHTLKIADKPDFLTRDQLVVEADLIGEPIFIIVNHWPSRRGGEKRSSPLREAAAELTKHIIDSLNLVVPNAKVVVMGDLNDDPTNKSVKVVLNTSVDKNDVADGQMYNPMEKFYKKGLGTLAYNDSWNLFDQLILTKAFLNTNALAWKFYKAEIYKEDKLIQTEGQYKGYPKRTYSFGNWIGGYSDHFPVYMFLIREQGEHQFMQINNVQEKENKNQNIQKADQKNQLRSGVHKPEFLDQLYLLNVKDNSLQLVTKEANTYGMKQYGTSINYKFDGPSSKTIVPYRSNTAFIISTTTPMSLSAYSLYKLDVKKGKYRSFGIASGGFAKAEINKSAMQVNYKKVGDDVYEFVPANTLLVGEYVLTNGVNSYTFSVQ